MAKKLAAILATCLLAVNAFSQSSPQAVHKTLNYSTGNFDMVYVQENRTVQQAQFPETFHPDSNEVRAHLKVYNDEWVVTDEGNDGTIESVALRRKSLSKKTVYEELAAVKTDKKYAVEGAKVSAKIIEKMYTRLRENNGPKNKISLAVDPPFFLKETLKHKWDSETMNVDLTVSGKQEDITLFSNCFFSKTIS
ncbi:MAG: hypothetical protein ACI8Y7_000714 [Candidatus Woesearchaeota archaeon]|jgi:hypothetical protein